MLKLTLDTNCFIALNINREPPAGCLRGLLHLHQANKVLVRLSAIGASENQPGGAPPLANFEQFRARLATIGLDGVELLKPPVIWGFAYWGESLWCGDDCLQLAQEIHAAMFPNRDFRLQDRLAAATPSKDPEQVKRAWRRDLCDVLTVWCHIHNDDDILVTSDNDDMLKHRDQLLRLGAREVLPPCDTLGHVRQHLGSST